jgi:hypothetical protein
MLPLVKGQGVTNFFHPIWLRQCRPELNVIVRVGRHTLSPAFPVPLPGKEKHWQSQWHTD